MFYSSEVVLGAGAGHCRAPAGLHGPGIGASPPVCEEKPISPFYIAAELREYYGRMKAARNRSRGMALDTTICRARRAGRPEGLDQF